MWVCSVSIGWALRFVAWEVESVWFLKLREVEEVEGAVEVVEGEEVELPVVQAVGMFGKLVGEEGYRMEENRTVADLTDHLPDLKEVGEMENEEVGHDSDPINH